MPFFLRDGPQLGRGDGSELEPLELPQDFVVLLLLPDGAQSARPATSTPPSTSARSRRLRRARSASFAPGSPASAAPRDLAALPANDLASSPLAAELLALGAFRADVSGAGPTVYGLFSDRAAAGTRDEALAGPRAGLDHAFLRGTVDA